MVALKFISVTKYLSNGKFSAFNLACFSTLKFKWHLPHCPCHERHCTYEKKASMHGEIVSVPAFAQWAEISSNFTAGS